MSALSVHEKGGCTVKSALMSALSVLDNCPVGTSETRGPELLLQKLYSLSIYEKRSGHFDQTLRK